MIRIYCSKTDQLKSFFSLNNSTRARNMHKFNAINLMDFKNARIIYLVVCPRAILCITA